jgi:hypothetical protein
MLSFFTWQIYGKKFENWQCYFYTRKTQHFLSKGEQKHNSLFFNQLRKFLGKIPSFFGQKREKFRQKRHLKRELFRHFDHHFWELFRQKMYQKRDFFRW